MKMSPGCATFLLRQEEEEEQKTVNPQVDGQYSDQL